MLELISFMALAIALGFKHSYDSDHLIAVSNIVRKVESMKSAAKAGFSWAIGHIITAAIIAILLYSFKESFLNGVLPHFEKVIGITLVLLGLISLKDLINFHSHKHRHGNIMHSHSHIHYKTSNHFHGHMFGIGIIQGLASSDELLLLFTASLAAASLGILLLGISSFSFGVILGMMFFTLLFSYPLLKFHQTTIYRLVTFGTGSIGIVYGVLMLFAVV
ncbi:hypothetical protein HYW20_03730 [Candidatus Woesearchaeota archaeon]|nr:hypothetical protein [Candidatus Woesearchaeota archaeon]